MKFVKIALILMLLLACNLTLSAAIPASERQALIDLYNSTNGAKWARLVSKCCAGTGSVLSGTLSLPMAARLWASSCWGPAGIESRTAA